MMMVNGDGDGDGDDGDDDDNNDDDDGDDDDGDGGGGKVEDFKRLTCCWHVGHFCDFPHNTPNYMGKLANDLILLLSQIFACCPLPKMVSIPALMAI